MIKIYNTSAGNARFRVRLGIDSIRRLLRKLALENGIHLLRMEIAMEI